MPPPSVPIPFPVPLTDHQLPDKSPEPGGSYCRASGKRALQEVSLLSPAFQSPPCAHFGQHGIQCHRPGTSIFLGKLEGASSKAKRAGPTRRPHHQLLTDLGFTQCHAFLDPACEVTCDQPQLTSPRLLSQLPRVQTGHPENNAEDL